MAAQLPHSGPNWGVPPGLGSPPAGWGGLPWAWGAPLGSLSETLIFPMVFQRFQEVLKLCPSDDQVARPLRRKTLCCLSQGSPLRRKTFCCLRCAHETLRRAETHVNSRHGTHSAAS